MYFEILVFLFKALIPESVKVNSTAQCACQESQSVQLNLDSVCLIVNFFTDFYSKQKYGGPIWLPKKF